MLFILILKVVNVTKEDVKNVLMVSVTVFIDLEANFHEFGTWF